MDAGRFRRLGEIPGVRHEEAIHHSPIDVVDAG
jgi:hypothetical protein